ncbi:hypothetical protein SBRCBS47491_007722 [Sporothrix bragantina]|uniref:ABM domain-containing protein n=1 Tax=Sporothrix bragantina TaxID=671064 RepID=A0ABP0CFJ5_9PEZI
MTVTEFGVTKAAGATVTPEFRAALENALAAQTRWLKIDPAATGANAVTGDRAWLYQQVEDPASALMIATWTDVDQHTSWATTEPDRETIMPAIGKHLHIPSEADPSPTVILVHTEGDHLSKAATPAGQTALVDSPVISVTRFFVTPGKKAEFEAAYNDTKGDIAQFAAPHSLQGSWRVDQESPEKEEYVLVCGWDNKEAHLAIAQSDVAPKLGALLGLTDGHSSLHYKRLL